MAILPVLGERPAQARRSAIALGDAQHLGGLDLVRHERSSQPQHVGPILVDEAQVDPVTGDRVEWPVVRGRVDAPPALVGEPGQAGRELEPEEAEQAEDLVGIAGGVGDDLLRAGSGVDVK